MWGQGKFRKGNLNEACFNKRSEKSWPGKGVGRGCVPRRKEETVQSTGAHGTFRTSSNSLGSEGRVIMGQGY